MSKLAVVYWTGTGNTEQMAAEVAAGAREKGAEAEVLHCSAFDAADCAKYDAFAFGCPAMGAEELEDAEFEPVFSACLPNIKGKKLGLFGSYGWGDGEWMRAWEDACRQGGAEPDTESVICCGAPDGDAAAKLRAMGAALAG